MVPSCHPQSSWCGSHHRRAFLPRRLVLVWRQQSWPNRSPESIGMIQSRSGTGLALEAFTQLPIVCKFLWQEFQSDKPSEARVLCFVHHAHAARTQLLQDAIVRDGGADHTNGNGVRLLDIVPQIVLVNLRAQWSSG